MGITWIGIVLNLGMGLLKLWAGLVANSRALMADGLHSLVDLSTDLAVVFGLKAASKPGDLNHPYGHHKFSSFAQLLIALVIVGFSVGLIANAIRSFTTTERVGPGLLAFWIALLSVLSKEALFRLTAWVARQQRSRLLMTNAWHHRTDSVSSVMTMAAVGWAYWGGPDWFFLDGLLAVALGLYLAVIGARMSLQGVNDLLDRAPASSVLSDIREHILPTEGVRGYHQFRARQVGDMVDVDVHVQVDPHLTVERGHEIARLVRNNIISRHPEVLDVLIHIEPATEEHLTQNKGLSGLGNGIPPSG